MPIVYLLSTEIVLKKTKDVEQNQKTYASVATDLISSGVYRLVEVFFQNIILGSFQQSQSLHVEPTYRKIIKGPIQGRRHHQVCYLVENKI